MMRHAANNKTLLYSQHHKTPLTPISPAVLDISCTYCTAFRLPHQLYQILQQRLASVASSATNWHMIQRPHLLQRPLADHHINQLCTACLKSMVEIHILLSSGAEPAAYLLVLPDENFFAILSPIYHIYKGIAKSVAISSLMVKH
jgi:hypothetical protein